MFQMNNLTAKMEKHYLVPVSQLWGFFGFMCFLVTWDRSTALWHNITMGFSWEEEWQRSTTISIQTNNMVEKWTNRWSVVTVSWNNPNVWGERLTGSKPSLSESCLIISETSQVTSGSYPSASCPQTACYKSSKWHDSVGAANMRSFNSRYGMT